MGEKTGYVRTHMGAEGIASLSYQIVMCPRERYPEKSSSLKKKNCSVNEEINESEFAYHILLSLFSLILSITFM